MKTITLIIISTFIVILSIGSRAYAGYDDDLSEILDSLETGSIISDSIIYDSLPTEEQEKQVIIKGDTTYISFGNKKIQIIEKDGQTDVKIKDKQPGDAEDYDFKKENEESAREEDKENDRPERPGKDFKGHWAGFEFGLNNYVDNKYSLSRSPQSSFSI